MVDRRKCEIGLGQSRYHGKTTSFIDKMYQLKHVHPFFITVAKEKLGNTIKARLYLCPRSHCQVCLAGLCFHLHLIVEGILHSFCQHIAKF